MTTSSSWNSGAYINKQIAVVTSLLSYSSFSASVWVDIYKTIQHLAKKVHKNPNPTID